MANPSDSFLPSTKEYLVIQKYFSRLYHVIDDPVSLAISLFSAGLISDWTMKASCETSYVIVRNYHLLDGIIGAVVCNPNNLLKIISILEDHPPLDSIAQEMKTDYESQDFNYQPSITLPADIQSNKTVTVDESVHKELFIMQGKLGALVLKVQKIAESANVNIDTLKQLLILSYPFEELGKEIRRAGNLAEVFVAVRKLCSPVNLNVLVAIADHSRLSDALIAIKEYEFEEEIYRKKLLSSTFAQELKKEVELTGRNPTSKNTITLHLNWASPESFTVKEFEKIVKDVFSDQSRYFYIIKVEAGSIIVTMCVPESEMGKLVVLAKTKLQYLLKIGAILLKIGDEIILDEEVKEITTHEIARPDSNANQKSAQDRQTANLLPTVLEQVKDFSSKWNILGIHLNLGQAAMDEIAIKYTNNPANCLIAMLDKWIQATPEPGPYWEQLADAVRKTGSEAKADEIIKHFCKEPGPTSITPVQPEWWIDSKFGQLTANFPVEDVLQLKLLCKPFLVGEAENIENANEALTILQMLHKKFGLDSELKVVIYDIFCCLQLQHLIPDDFQPDASTTVEQLNHRDYIYAKCMVHIAQSLQPEEVQNIINSMSGIYNNIAIRLNSKEATGIKLIYELDRSHLVSPTHVARLYVQLKSIGKMELAGKLIEYLKQTGQETVHTVSFPSVVRPTTSIEISPILSAASITEIETRIQEGKFDALPKTLNPLSHLLTNQLKTQQQMLIDAQDQISKLVQERLKEQAVSQSTVDELEKELTEQKEMYQNQIAYLEQQLNRLSKAITTSLPVPGPCYTLSTQFNNRGCALIINNFKFRGGPLAETLPQRKASEIDEFNLTQMFGIRLGYQPIVFGNVNYEDMKTNIQRYTTLALPEQDSFVCFFLSYGQGNHIYSSDGVKMDINSDILPLFNTSTLKDKPKLIFVYSVLPPNPSTDDEVSPSIPLSMKDTLLTCTSSPQSEIDKDDGSLYIRTLFRVLFSNSTTYDLVSMMTMVQEEMTRAGSDDVQIVVSTLSKQMRFFSSSTELPALAIPPTTAM